MSDNALVKELKRDTVAIKDFGGIREALQDLGISETGINQASYKVHNGFDLWKLLTDKEYVDRVFTREDDLENMNVFREFIERNRHL